MCLIPEEGYVGKNRVKYKIVFRGPRKNTYVPVYQKDSHVYKIGEMVKCIMRDDLSKGMCGFHVFRSKKDIKEFLKTLKIYYPWADGVIIVKVKVEGFIAGGVWAEITFPFTETWEKMTILEEL